MSNHDSVQAEVYILSYLCDKMILLWTSDTVPDKHVREISLKNAVLYSSISCDSDTYRRFLCISQSINSTDFIAAFLVTLALWQPTALLWSAGQLKTNIWAPWQRNTGTTQNKKNITFL